MFDTFPSPQKPSAKQIRAVADAARDLRALRRQIMDDNGRSLRDLYRTLETPGDNSFAKPTPPSTPPSAPPTA